MGFSRGTVVYPAGITSHSNITDLPDFFDFVPKNRDD